jgi:transposase InsO family protein
MTARPHLEESKRPPTKRRYWQYEVTAVGGSMEGRVEVGALTLDYWQGQRHTYTIMDLSTGEVTGWYSVKKVAPATPEQYAQLVEAGR